MVRAFEPIDTFANVARVLEYREIRKVMDLFIDYLACAIKLLRLLNLSVAPLNNSG